VKDTRTTLAEAGVDKKLASRSENNESPQDTTTVDPAGPPGRRRQKGGSNSGNNSHIKFNLHLFA
jgi:hypothetical protein